MDELQLEQILEHSTSPRHRGRLECPDGTGEAVNRVCGDRVRIDVRLGVGPTIIAVRFEAEGCLISQAAASLLCQYAEGAGLATALDWDADLPRSLLGIPLTPARLPCAALPLRALRIALQGARPPDDPGIRTAGRR